VIQFFTANDGIRARASVVGGFAAAAVMAIGLSFAAPASAAQVTINSATPLGYGLGIDTTNVAFGQSDAWTADSDFTGLMSPYVVAATEGGIDFTVLAFCVDFHTDLSWNFDPDVAVLTVNDTAYHDGSLNTVPDFDDPGGVKAAHVYNLIDLGQTLWAGNLADKNLRLSAVQGAIWQVMTGKTFEFADYGAGGAVANLTDYNDLIQTYVNMPTTSLPSTSAIRVLTSVDGQAQALAYAVQTAVPEPSTWAMMIGGFAGMGSMLRFRRRMLARG